jgi:hypothetical protein
MVCRVAVQKIRESSFDSSIIGNIPPRNVETTAPIIGIMTKRVSVSVARL